MTELKELMEKRIKAKKKKPVFLRKDHHRKPKLEKKWKKPRGLQNKLRLKKKGHAMKPSKGFGSPSKVKGLHSSGLIPILISNIGELGAVTKEKGVLLSARIGDRKRKAIIEEVKKKGLMLLNHDADKTLAKIDLNLKKRKEKKKKKQDEKKEKKKGIEDKVKKEEKKKAEEKKKEAATAATEAKVAKEEMTDDEKKKIEKQEKDKLLTKKT